MQKENLGPVRAPSTSVRGNSRGTGPDGPRVAREKGRSASVLPMGCGPFPSVDRPSGATVAASAKLVVVRLISSDHEVSGRVALATLAEVPELLPNSLMLLLVETPSIFDHRHPRDATISRRSHQPPGALFVQLID